MNYLKSFFKLSRPILIPILLVCLSVSLFFSTSIESITLFSIIEIILVSFLTPFFIFSINDFYDVESDILNKRKNNLLQGFSSKNIYSSKKFIFHTNLIIFIVLFGFSLFSKNIEHIITMFVLLFIAYFYSAKPIRFKEMLLLDSISNGVLVFSYFALIYTLYNSIITIPLEVILIAISTMAYHLLAAEIDKESDFKANQKTTATIIDNRNTIFLICILLNLPLFFINLNSVFSYLVYLNLFMIFISYFFKHFNKSKLIFIFLIFWFSITILYILKKLFF